MNTETLLTILGMALVTYATRVTGLWLLGRMQPSARLERWLRHIPGAVLVSIVVPMAAAGGPAEWLALAATAFTAVRTRSMLAAMIVGVAVVVLARRFLSPLAGG